MFNKQENTGLGAYSLAEKAEPEIGGAALELTRDSVSSRGNRTRKALDENEWPGVEIDPYRLESRGRENSAG